MIRAILAAPVCLAALAQCVAADQLLLRVACWPADDVRALVEGQFGETPAAVGTTPNGWPVAWFGNPQTGTWSVIYLRPDGTACVIAAGVGFERVAPPPEGDPA